MENLIFSLNATIPIFLTMVIGYILKQVKMVDDHFVKVLNKFNYNISLPVLLFLDLYQADFFTVWDTKYVLFCFIATFICAFVIGIVTYFTLKDKSILGEFIQASTRGSAAVLGIAFILNIYGEVKTTPLMIIGTVPLYNMLAVFVLSVTKPSDDGQVNSSFFSKQILKDTIKGIVTNPIILGILVGLIFSLSGIKIPAIILKTGSNISVLATPLALIGLGAGFEGRKALSKIKPTLICSVIKLMIQPAIFLPIAASLGFYGEKMVALLVMLGAPTTASCYIMAKNMDHEGVLTSSVVVTTTFLSALSLTFWLFVLRSLNLI